MFYDAQNPPPRRINSALASAPTQRSRLNREERKLWLQQQEYIEPASVKPTSVFCRRCSCIIRLDRRYRFHLSAWKKHVPRCPGSTGRNCRRRFLDATLALKDLVDAIRGGEGLMLVNVSLSSRILCFATNTAVQKEGVQFENGRMGEVSRRQAPHETKDLHAPVPALQAKYSFEMGEDAPLSTAYISLTYYGTLERSEVSLPSHIRFYGYEDFEQHISWSLPISYLRTHDNLPGIE